MEEVPSDLLRLKVRCDSDAPSKVRDAMSRLGHFDWILGDAMLIASELVTNAVLYSGCTPAEDVDVSVSTAGDRLLIAVEDPGRSGLAAEVRPPSDVGYGGYGLLVVDQLARRWGSERDGRYRVWAELSVPATAPR